MYTKVGPGWVLSSTVTPSSPTVPEAFGYSLALDGDTLVVGAPSEVPPTMKGPYVGAAYVFRRQGGGWVQEARLTASDPTNYADFGWTVGVSGDTVVVGAPIHAHSFSPIEPPAPQTGGVYIFTRSQGAGGPVWTQSLELLPNDTQALQKFGRSVAWDGVHLAVGAMTDHPSGFRTGAVYVFTGGGASWTQRAKLWAADAKQFLVGSTTMSLGSGFGSALALDGGTLVAGADGDCDGGVYARGAAYVFSGAGSTWVQTAKLLGSVPGTHAALGSVLSVDQGRVLLGGRFNDMPQILTGEAYLFAPVAGVWTELLRLTASDTYVGQGFGHDVALQGNEAFVHAPDNNGPPFDEAVYIYTLSGLPSTDGGLASDGGGKPDGRPDAGPVDASPHDQAVADALLPDQTVVTGPDQAVVPPPDMGMMPPDQAVVPPPDKGVIAPDHAVVPPLDKGVIAPDKGVVANPDHGVAPTPDKGVTARDKGVVPNPDRGVMPPDARTDLGGCCSLDGAPVDIRADVIADPDAPPSDGRILDAAVANDLRSGASDGGSLDRSSAADARLGLDEGRRADHDGGCGSCSVPSVSQGTWAPWLASLWWWRHRRRKRVSAAANQAGKERGGSAS
ncbi:MAG: FG-GAP repeat protein [Deltaproteobacteria bacterium]|nr:FG-GAP repeat protein [Deltaproteobacteria bacterium]